MHYRLSDTHASAPSRRSSVAVISSGLGCARAREGRCRRRGVASRCRLRRDRHVGRVSALWVPGGLIVSADWPGWTHLHGNLCRALDNGSRVGGTDGSSAALSAGNDGHCSTGVSHSLDLSCQHVSAKRWTHEKRDETASLDAERSVPNRPEERIDDARVGGDADEGRGVLGEDLVHLQAQTESLLGRLLLVDRVPLLVLLGE